MLHDKTLPPTPLITIGITCFNAAETIGRAIDSALGQTWSNFEIIVVDDYSQDTSVGIIQSYIDRCDNIKLIKNNKNMGVSYNRQALLQAAQGEYLVYFDDDDWSFPDRLEKQYKRIQNYKDKTGTENIFCYGDRIVIQEGSEDITIYGIGRTSKEPSGMLIIDYILGNKKPHDYAWGAMGSGTMMGAVHTFKQAGGFDSTFRRSAEIDLALRAASKIDLHAISTPSPVIYQYVTASEDKSLWKKGKYQIFMILKHWRLVIKRRLFFRCFYPFTDYIFKIIKKDKS